MNKYIEESHQLKVEDMKEQQTDYEQKQSLTSEEDSVFNDTTRNAQDLFADLEATLDEVAESNPRIERGATEPAKTTADLKAVLEASLATNSSLVLEDVLQIVMRKAIELMQAERGLIMLLDEAAELQVKTAYNLCAEDLHAEEFKISTTVAAQVAASGKSVYTSDALEDDRYANQPSVVELHLRSIICVPLKVKEEIIGVIYVDNSNQAKMFLKSDLYLFELYAQIVSHALHNASIHHSLLSWKKYNESVIKNSPVGIIVLDTSGRTVTVNAEALEILDLNRNDIRLAEAQDNASVFVDILPEEERPRWQQIILSVIETGSEFSDSRFFHNTGFVEKALSLKALPIAELPHREHGIVMSVEDITEKVIMEKYVILSEKLVAKGEMAASIAHELNNYLAIASNNAELLSVNVERERYDKARFNSRTIVENIFKIKRFVDGMMDFSLPQTEHISYDIKHLIEDLLFSLRVQPRFKRTHFTIEMGKGIPNVEMDVGQIQQVLMNLLNNAADAIEEKVRAHREGGGADFRREITMATSREGDTVVVEIADNGKGIDPDTLSKVFEMHFSTKKAGHGLGLSNCRKIIEQHHGELTAQSTPGEGTTFRLTLPVAQPRDKSPTA